MINTALSSPGPNSRFSGRSTVEHVHGILLEHVYGILLDEKFLYRSVHAAFVNTKWYEAWLERTLLLHPIIFDMSIACVSVFSASGTARARSFFTHERSRTTESTVSEHIDHKDRRQVQLFQRLALRRGRANFCNICQHTSSRPPIAGLFVTPWNKDDMGDGVPTDQVSHNHCDCTDSHCNSHIVTSFVFVLVLHSHHKSIGGRLLLLPRAARDGLALCHLSRQDTSRGVPLTVRTGARCVRAEGSRPRLTAGTMERQRVKEDNLVEGIMCLFTLPSQDQPPEHKWTLPSSMTTTSPSCLSMRCRSLRMRTRKASLVSFCQDTICSRHDLSRHISRCLFLSHKTRSVKTISRCLFLSHTPCQLLRFR